MKLKRFLGLIAATSLSVEALTLPSPANAQSDPCPNPSTLTSVDGAGDATSFRSITGDGTCSGTPSSYGVTIYKMGLCTSDPSPAQGAAADYSSCSISYEDSAGSSVNFAAGTSLALSEALSLDIEDGTYGYAMILLSKTFNIKAEYGPIAGNTYYSTNTSTGWPAQGNTVGPATVNPVSANSFGQNCDSADTLSIPAGSLTGTLLNSSGERIPEDTSIQTCSGVEYILGVVGLNSPVTIEDGVTLEALFTITNSGTTLNIDNAPGGVPGIIFDVGPFNVTFNVIRSTD